MYGIFDKFYIVFFCITSFFYGPLFLLRIYKIKKFLILFDKSCQSYRNTQIYVKIENFKNYF